MSRKAGFIIFLFVTCAFSNCFGSIDKRGSVRSYDKGLVKTVGGNFRVSPLSGDWEQKDIDYRAVLFRNRVDQATITISSWCKRAADSGSLETLTENLYAGIENVKRLEGREVPLGGRTGYVSAARGEVDSVPVYLKTYVLRMNECVFDFLYVSTPERNGSVSDFDRMVGGFAFVKGPEIL